MPFIGKATSRKVVAALQPLSLASGQKVAIEKLPRDWGDCPSTRVVGG
jgi:hypothetical protein